MKTEDQHPPQGEVSILVVGASGMLGNRMFLQLSRYPQFQVYGTLRSDSLAARFPERLRGNLIAGIDIDDLGTLARVLEQRRPDVVINCIGLVKQLSAASDPVMAIEINALLPHRLARLCAQTGSRLIHFSTDCVFDGKKGHYQESDPSNATDLYGRSKLLGEVDYSNAITLRTSIIGREMSGSHGLVDWFLSESGPIKGYRRAIFSGLTTNEMARVVAEYVIPRPQLHGVYQVASDPIDKYTLLQLINARLEKPKVIVEDEAVAIDRSLDATRFNAETGYKPPDWEIQVKDMMTDNKELLAND